MSWPKDDKWVVAEMLRDRTSLEWIRCREFLTARIRFIFGGSCPDDMREDVVQETMLKVFRSLKNFTFKHTLAVWLSVILVHTTIDFVRRERIRKTASLEAMQEKEEWWEVAVEGRTLEDQCLTREEINEALADYRAWLKKNSRKPERDYKIWERCMLEGQKVEDVAARFNVSTHVVYQVLYKARQYFLKFRRKDSDLTNQ